MRPRGTAVSKIEDFFGPGAGHRLAGDPTNQGALVPESPPLALRLFPALYQGPTTRKHRHRMGSENDVGVALFTFTQTAVATQIRW